MELISVTDLAGNTEPLVGFKGLRRRRAINGEKILSFSLYPSEDNKFSFDFVKEESRIEFDGETYIVKSLQEINVGKTYFKQVECIHEFFVRMNQKQKDTSHTGSMTIQDATNFIFEGTGYQPVIIDPFYAERFENFGKENRLALLNKALGRYKAEITIISNQVRFRKKIGEDTDFQFRYNFNVKTFEKDVDTKPLRTYIKGYGKDGLVREYTSPNKDIFGYSEAPILEDERFTTIEGLDAALKESLQDTPVVSITIDFVDLRKAGYPYIIPNEGDRVFLIYEPMNVDIEARIIEIEEEYDENLDPIRTKVTLSNKKDDFAGTLFDYVDKGFSRILDDGGKVKYNVLDDAVRIATEAIKSAQTELTFENGILAINPENPNEIVIFNSAGIGISRDGGHTFKEALTYEGLVASVGVIGELSANHIRGGLLKSLNNRFQIDLEASGIDFYSETGKLVTQITQAKTRQADGSSAEITYFGVSEAAGVATGLALGKRASDGSFGNSIYVESRYGDVYMRPPTLYIIPSEKMRVEARAEFHHPVRFDASPLSKIEGAMKGEEWTIVPGEGTKGGVAIRPWTSGNGSLGTAIHRWDEAWIGWINGRDIGLVYKKVDDTAFATGEAQRTADWASGRAELAITNAANAAKQAEDNKFAIGEINRRLDDAFRRIEALERKP
ncbi:phage tail protein [Bacillus sp. FSL R7-0642]|uniref:phage tail protein n=1 Tax=Bacillus sp. FSL R7-0642 TaxID=2921585 RepID=UPI0030F5F998